MCQVYTTHIFILPIWWHYPNSSSNSNNNKQQNSSCTLQKGEFNENKRRKTKHIETREKSNKIIWHVAREYLLRNDDANNVECKSLYATMWNVVCVCSFVCVLFFWLFYYKSRRINSIVIACYNSLYGLLNRLSTKILFNLFLWILVEYICW